MPLWSNLMDMIKRDFSDEKENIKNFFEYIQNQENSTNAIVNPMQKSSCILVLYNLIESMFSKLLKHIHDTVLNGSIMYDTLNDNIRKTILMYYESTLSNIGKNHIEIEGIFYTHRVNIPYKELMERYKLFSGNLDAKEIREVIKNKYGFIIKNERNLNVSELLEIKNGRNKLAHGETSFRDYAIEKNLTIQDIDNLRIKVFDFLDSLIQEFESYLNSQDYLKR